MMSLPEAFLSLRREALTVATNRGFRGSTDPIPDVPAWPGVFRPIPTDGILQAKRLREAAARTSHNRRNQKWRQTHAVPRAPGPRVVRIRPTHHFNPCRSNAVGSIPIGARVELRSGQVAYVLAYLEAWSDPMVFIPSGFEPTRIRGIARPSLNPRYLVVVHVGRGPRLFFPRAASLERDNPEMAVAS